MTLPQFLGRDAAARRKVRTDPYDAPISPDGDDSP